MDIVKDSNEIDSFNESERANCKKFSEQMYKDLVVGSCLILFFSISLIIIGVILMKEINYLLGYIIIFGGGFFLLIGLYLIIILFYKF